jgi:AcrR family transcriptional regulator
MAPDAAEKRKPRADALRNRERLIDEAKAAFGEVGPHVGLDEIARRAEVGIGTLYRHFPTRDAIVEAVYRREIGQLADAARTLLEAHPPLEALRAWLRLFVDYMATKRLIGPALLALPGGPSALYESSGTLIMAAMTLLVQRGVAAGDIRADIGPEDLMQALSGLAFGYSEAGWEARTLRLIDVFTAGLRPDRR